MATEVEEIDVTPQWVSDDSKEKHFSISDCWDQQSLFVCYLVKYQQQMLPKIYTKNTKKNT